jgi:O-antigen ligase
MYLAMNGKGVPRVLGLIAPPLTVLLIAVAASRGGALMIVGIILFMLFRTRVKGWVRYLSAAVMLALMSVGPGAELLLGRFTDVRDMLSIVVRFMYFREAWHRTLDHWPIGMGLGDALNYHDRLNGEDAHNYWLMLASELGLIGLVLWIGVLIVLYRRILRMLQNPETRLIGQAIQLTFWIAMVNCLFEPTFNGLQYQFTWYWIVGLYLGWMEQLSGRYPPPMTGSRTHEPLAAGSRTPT